MTVQRSSRRCKCGNFLDRGPGTTKCGSCISVKSSVVEHGPVTRVCAECGLSYQGRRRVYCTSFCRNTANERAKQDRAGTVKVTEKYCGKCGETRPAYMFSMDSTHVDGLTSQCRSCKSAKHAAWREEHPNHARSSNLMRSYGLTVEEYEFLFQFQEGLCWLCKKPWNSETRRFSVDHDHQTGAIRSLTCFYCNRYRISSLTLEQAKSIVAYLENPSADLAFGRRRFVPKGMERGYKKRNKKRSARRPRHR
jgi:recombination endonuclease VII